MAIGSQLKKARQKKQLTINEVYQRTRISPDTLSALEDDNLQKLPEPIYVRSFLKEYARFLGLDTEAILKEYADTASMKGPVKGEVPVNHVKLNQLKPASHKVDKEKIIRVIKPVSTGVLIIILAVFSFRALGAARGRFLSWQIKCAEHGKTVKSIKPVPEKEKPAAQAPVEKPVLKQDSILIPKNEKLELSIMITDDVWAEIKRDGNIILSGTLKKGTTRNWQADESFEIWTGNASVMELTPNGRNLGPVGRGVKRGVIIDRQGIRK